MQWICLFKHQILQKPEHGSLRIRAHLSWRTGKHLMFSTCSELIPSAPILDGRMERIMQPWVKSCMRTWLKTVSKNARGFPFWKVKSASGPLLSLHRGPLSAWEREPPKISSDARTKASGQLSKPKTESWELLKNNNWQHGEKVDFRDLLLGRTWDQIRPLASLSGITLTYSFLLPRSPS